jgi:hypothetical protein
MNFNFINNGTTDQRTIDISNLVIAGFTGRDPVALEKHILELEQVGIPRPAITPIFFHVGSNLLTHESAIQVSSTTASGEAEAVVFNIADEKWVGLGSDHTDRKLEATSIVLSKQVCPKPISSSLWRLADVEAHWNELEMRSWLIDAGQRSLYQEGTLAGNLHPNELIKLNQQRGGSFNAGSAMYCGTLSAIGPICFSEKFEIELYDPVLDRRLNHAYDVIALPG